MAKELRCPSCQRSVMPESLAYSSVLGMFVCPACRASTPAPLPEAPPAPPALAARDARESRTPVKVPVPPPPSFLDSPVPPPPPPPPAPVTEVSPASPAADIQAVVAPSRFSRSPLLIGAALLTLAVIVTVVAIMLSRNVAQPPVDPQRAWDQAHHAEIIAIKSQAEALAIDGKLKEAHAKYREIEKIIGGRQVKEPTLFDMVEVARQDQDRVYKLLLSQLEQERAPAAETQQADETPAATPPPPQIAAPTQAYPQSFDSLRGQTTTEPIVQGPPAPSTVATTTTAPAPTTIAAAEEPTTIPAGAVQFLEIPRGPVSDQQIGDAISRGVDFLLSNFENGEIRGNLEERESYREGMTALCIYALASSGKAIVDPRLSSKSPEMIQMLEKLKSYPLQRTGEVHAPLVYSRSLRACALSTLNRAQDRDVLEDDVAWLINAGVHGGYTYDDSGAPPYKPRQRRRPATAPRAALSDGIIPAPRGPADAQIILTDGVFTPRPPGPMAPKPQKVFENNLPPRPQQRDRYGPAYIWDNSNSQYGLLGVWAGAEVGCEVPSNYWRNVQRHWVSCQLPSGEWPYAAGGVGKLSMTAGGITSLLVTYDYLEAPLLTGKLANSRQPYSVSLSAGLAWLEDHDNCVSVELLPDRRDSIGYNLFAVERVGLASGFKHFGRHDWFVELARKALPAQFQNGAFGAQDAGADAVIDTAFALLFLSRGRHPIMVNKLRYDGNWTNRPREIANLTSFTARELERPLNWQVVDITREPSEWADAPILFMSGQMAVKLTEEEMSKLAEFVDNGGILFTHADLGSAQFNKFAMELSQQLFPKHGPLKDLPADHALFKVNYQIGLPRPRFQGVSNGVRLVMVHCPVDLSNAWQVRATVSRKEAFHLGANLYLYATGKEKFRNRLDTPWIPWPQEPPLREIPLARLVHSGNWDPEPGAWLRMQRKLHWETGAALEIKKIPITELSHEQFRLAHLTGVEAIELTADELAAMKRFVESGGTLLIDAAGGSPTFADAEAAWLPKILGDAKLETVRDDDPLLKHTQDGTVDMPAKTLRLFALQQLGNDASQRLKIARVGPRQGRVIFSPLDVTSGLLGTNTWGIVGYLPEYSEALVRNVVMTTR